MVVRLHDLPQPNAAAYVMLRQTQAIMGMPVTVAIRDGAGSAAHMDLVFAHFRAVDERFSPFNPASEVARINRGEVPDDTHSLQMREVLSLAADTCVRTQGYFNVRRPDGMLDPSGIVKGWAIQKAALMLAELGHADFFVDAGGDIQSRGRNEDDAEWRIGIRNPFRSDQIVKVLCPRGAGIATSGSYLQGAHIYDPHRPGQAPMDIVSLTVIGPDILEADRFATAAFAMGRQGLVFIEAMPGFEAYAIDVRGMAGMTGGLGRYLPC